MEARETWVRGEQKQAKSQLAGTRQQSLVKVAVGRRMGMISVLFFALLFALFWRTQTLASTGEEKTMRMIGRETEK